MKLPRTELPARYLAALRSDLAHKGLVQAESARSLGRAVLAGGLVTLDLAAMHERAMVALAPSFDFANTRNGALRRTGSFFSRALVPLEAAQRATREANRNLRQHNETLRRHAVALARGNRRLQREIVRRKAGEAAVLKGRRQYQALFLESQVMQKKFRQLTRQILSAQEEERKKISRELHDEVVQTLVGINVELSALGRSAAVGAHTLKTKIAHTQRIVENSVNAVHRFARELRPAVLDDLGLIPALHAFSKALAARKKFKIQLTAFRGVELLNAEKRAVLFRVATEALTNVARHAQATEVIIKITEIQGAIRMEIGDNGKSFRVKETLLARNNKRLGLVGMRERIEMIGGRLAIESAPGRGTTVRAEIPFKSHPLKK